MKVKNNQAGSLTIPLLTTTATFLIIIYSLLFLLTNQFNFTWRQQASEEALNIAEAGINYYRWHLAHAPDDFQDGSSQPGPYVHEYRDPQGDVVGAFSLEIDPPQSGSSIITVESTGWNNNFPDIKRKVVARLGQPSLARYAFMTNASAWFGSGVTINGLVHSNNGIRMDGVNTSIVTSAKETYICGVETGCSPPEEKPGIWGIGPGGEQGLWQFPSTPIDFDAIALNFNTMKQAAEEDGLYLPPSEARGYHFIFLDGGQVTVKKVTGTSSVEGYGMLEGCRHLYQRIGNEETIGTYNIADTPIVFVEDEFWVEGIIEGRITLVAARFPLDLYDMNVWIDNNLVYDSHDGSDALGLIAQNDIYFGLNLPNDFIVEGALLAKKGHIIRHGYLYSCGGSENAVRQSFTFYGSLISNLEGYWNFGTAPSSGFKVHTLNYDTHLRYNPPPYFPTLSGYNEYELIDWSEG